MKVLLLALIMVTFVPQTAYAYIDPGSGSAIISTIIGFFVAMGLIIKTYWYKLKSFVSPKSKKDDDV